MKHFGNQLDELFKKKRIIQKDFAEKMAGCQIFNRE